MTCAACADGCTYQMGTPRPDGWRRIRIKYEQERELTVYFCPSCLPCKDRPTAVSAVCESIGIAATLRRQGAESASLRGSCYTEVLFRGLEWLDNYNQE